MSAGDQVFYPFSMKAFVSESNRIEGIFRSPTVAEVEATQAFVDLQEMRVEALCKLVAVYQPDAKLRVHEGMNVRVGKYKPPLGGPKIQRMLTELLDAMSDDDVLDAYHGHVQYEQLHPFTDGNGRSGRALWLWAMGGIEKAPLGFLHHFYYQTLKGAAK